MKILFVHNNFPAQFRNLVVELAKRDDVHIAAIGCDTARSMRGVDLHRYRTPAGSPAAHTFARRFDHECRRAEQVLYAAVALKRSGFVPDVIMVHPGWGENLPLESVFPTAAIIMYCEFFYRPDGQDAGFDPEFPVMGLDGHVGLRARNAATLLGLASSVAGVSPTLWQKDTYPREFKSKISVIHDGVDTDLLKPQVGEKFALPSGITFTQSDEVVTYSARNLEPIRGFHVFMRALPKVLAKRPRAHVVILGGDSISYGVSPPNDRSWKAALLRELGGAIDLNRVHFLGRVSYSDYQSVLRISSAHIYFTYPFVLSWSLIEAMSMGCAIIASDTAPVREVLDETNGVLAPFFAHEELSDRIIHFLAHPTEQSAIRREARRTVETRFDSRRVCVPKLLDLVSAHEHR